MSIVQPVVSKGAQNDIYWCDPGAFLRTRGPGNVTWSAAGGHAELYCYNDTVLCTVQYYITYDIVRGTAPVAETRSSAPG
jgi:hypothetical protein